MNKGQKMSKEQKKKIGLANSISQIGNRNSKGHSVSMAVREIISRTNKGRYSGKKHWRYIGDRTKLSRVSKQGERRTSAYSEWRRQVWLRDNHKCKIANPDCDGRIEAHHILSWRDYPELRYITNNGITLCHAHHPLKRKDEAKLSPYFQSLVAETNQFV